MRKAPNEPTADKRGHVCPPSDATHPRDRWESLFIYSFVTKFTQLRGKVEGLNTPMEYVQCKAPYLFQVDVYSRQFRGCPPLE